MFTCYEHAINGVHKKLSSLAVSPLAASLGDFRERARYSLSEK